MTTGDTAGDTAVDTTGGAGQGEDTTPDTPAGSPGPRSGAEERGSLEVHSTVVRKIAEFAADETAGTRRRGRSLAGVGMGDQGATAKIDGHGDEVSVKLEVALQYPSPVRETAEKVRRRVAEEIGRITGYRVGAVQLTVSALVSESSSRSRVE